MKTKKYSVRSIAGALGRSVSTISNELTRNSVRRSYDPAKAHHKAYVRRQEAKYQGMRIVAHPELRTFVEDKLMEGRSPESVAGRIKKYEKYLPRVSADSIERFLTSVYGRTIEAHRKRALRRRMWKRRRPKVIQLKDRKFIDIRPQIIDRRGRIGDVEADFIVSKKGGTGILLTVADRKIRISFLEKVLPVSIENVHKAFVRIKGRFPEMRTVTTDNDILLQKHAELEALLGVKIYFCHPYHSWEKGTIENTNGEVRKSIPKGSDISHYSRASIHSIEMKTNDRYMECIGYQTPQEALGEYRKRKQRRMALSKRK